MLEDILSYFGMSHNPFPVALDPKNYYQTESSKAYLEEFLHGIESRKGFLVLVGEVGVGKTSLSLQLLKLLEEKKIPTSWVFNTVFTKEELLLAVARDWGLTPADDIPFPRLVDTIHHFLLDQNKAGNNCVILIDEAHNLDPTSLEALRMLSNLEYGGQKLVQILLIGQQELHLLLEEPRMRQLMSRVAIFLEQPTLTKAEVKGYVDFKLAKADSQLRLEDPALDRLWEASLGNLRQINLIMERALYACIALRENRLSAKVLDLSVRDVAACNRQVRARMRQGRNRRLTLRWGLPVLAVLALGLGYFLLHGGLARLTGHGAPKTAPSAPVPTQAPAPAPAPAQAAPAPAPSQAAPVPPQPAPDKNPALAEAEALLAPLGLEAQAQALAAAVKERKLSRFTSALPLDVCWIEAPRALGPDQPGSLTLPWGGLTRGHGVVVLLRAPQAFDRVAPGYEGPEALCLQNLLAAAGEFQDKPDGVFGKRTWYALSDFQKKNGLRPTGLPDRETLEKLSAQTAQVREDRP